MIFLLPVTLFCVLFDSVLFVHATASTSLQTETVYYLPPSSSTFSSLAKLSFNISKPELSKVDYFTPPIRSKTQSKEDVTTVGVILSRPIPKSLSANDPNLKYRTTLTSLASLHPPYRGRFALTVTEQGDVQSASWSAIAKDADFDGQGDFDMKIIREGPRPIMEVTPPPTKSGRAGAQQGQSQGAGEEEEAMEKTFLQKYWWAILGTLVLVMITGGGDEK